MTSNEFSLKYKDRPKTTFIIQFTKMQWLMCIINVCNVTKNRPMNQNTLMLAVLFFLFINVFFLVCI